MSVGGVSGQAFTPGCPAAQRCHVGLGPGFVDEDEPARVDPLLMTLPAVPAPGHIRPQLLGGPQRSFFERIPGPVNRIPDGAIIDPDAAPCQFPDKPPQGEGILDPPEQPGLMLAGDLPGTPAAGPAGGAAAGPAPALRPLHHTRWRNVQRRRHLPDGLTPVKPLHCTLPQVHRNRSGHHPCLHCCPDRLESNRSSKWNPLSIQCDVILL